MGEIQSVDRHTQRLEDRTYGGAKGCWQGVQELGRPRHDLSQTTILRTMTGEADRRTEVAMAGPALPAQSAWNRRIHCHGGTGERPLVRDTAHLVAKDKRPRQLRVPDSTLLEPVQVGPADADVGHADQGLAGSSDRRIFLVQLEITGGMQPYDAHQKRSPRAVRAKRTW